MIVKHNAHPTQTAERVAAKLRERGVPKTHAASEFAGKAPEDATADDLALLTEGRAKHINEAAPVPGTGSLDGDPKVIPTPNGTGSDDATHRGLMKENESAVTLKEKGYHVHQIDETQGSLDYRINGYEYDCKAAYFDPATSDLTQADAIKKLWKDLNEQKLVKGKTRIVLNLDDFNAPNDEVFQYYRDNPTLISDIDDMIVLKNGEAISFWDFLR